MTTTTQVSLQQDLQRFTARFIVGVSDAMTALIRSTDCEVSNTALQRALLYASSSLDIATGPFPEVNLLDMLVFLHLSHTVLERHWIPRLFGDGAEEAARVFDDSERVLWRIAGRTLDERARSELARAIDDWLVAQPGIVSVEWVRFEDFAERAGAAAADRARRASGALSSIRSATRAADEALLLAERAMFLVHRMPFLLRLHARLSVREILSDTVGLLRIELPLLSALRSTLSRWARRFGGAQARRASKRLTTK